MHLRLQGENWQIIRWNMYTVPQNKSTWYNKWSNFKVTNFKVMTQCSSYTFIYRFSFSNDNIGVKFFSFCFCCFYCIPYIYFFFTFKAYWHHYCGYSIRNIDRIITIIFFPLLFDDLISMQVKMVIWKNLLIFLIFLLIILITGIL